MEAGTEAKDASNPLYVVLPSDTNFTYKLRPSEVTRGGTVFPQYFPIKGESVQLPFRISTESYLHRELLSTMKLLNVN